MDALSSICGFDKCVDRLSGRDATLRIKPINSSILINTKGQGGCKLTTKKFRRHSLLRLALCP
jgi:hypothetical protein